MTEIGTIGPVLITGSEGFIGRAVVAKLRSRGETVIALDRTHAGASSDARIIKVEGDICDPNCVMDAMKHHDARAVLNLAALIIPACKADPVLGAQVDIIGHINVFEAARQLKIERVVYTSSVAAKPRAPYNSPINLYGVYKRACEDIAKVYHLDYGLASVGLRPNIVYGPGREVGETAFISQAIAAAVAGRPFAMPFTGEVCIQHIDEIVDVLVRSLYAEPDEPVVSDITTNVVAIDAVVDAINTAIPGAQITPSTRKRPAPCNLDNASLQALLGSWKTVSLEEGIQRTIGRLEARSRG